LLIRTGARAVDSPDVSGDDGERRRPGIEHGAAPIDGGWTARDARAGRYWCCGWGTRDATRLGLVSPHLIEDAEIVGETDSDPASLNGRRPNGDRGSARGRSSCRP
jgi:hypothetical protein